MSSTESGPSVQASERANAAPPMALGIFLISAAVLALQVLQTRVLSVMMWHHHSYMVVTMTLLGFAAAGSLTTVWPALLRGDLGRRLAWCALIFCASTFGGYLLLSATADRAAEMTAAGSFLSLALFYSYLLVPYFFAGLVIILILSVTRDVHRLYFVNLVGSALGAWVFILCISALGAERLLVLCAATGPLAALAFLRWPRGEEAPAGRQPVRLATWAAALACAGLFLTGDAWLEIGVANNKALVHEMARNPEAELVGQRWSPLCRLDLLRMPEDLGGAINIYQDGDAITIMHSDASFALQPPIALNTLAYLPHTQRREAERAAGLDEVHHPKALAIGIGGGIDLRYALDQEAQSVLGIEINPVTVDLVGREWAGFNGDIYHREGVEVVVGEGRSTLRRLDEKFDVIELSGTDTYTAGNAGAYVLSESYLYTSEALREYFEHLEPGGTLGMIRLAYDPPRENLRLFAIALTQLRDHFGIEKPSDHAAVIFHELYYPEIDELIRFSVCVFSIDPLPADALSVYALAENLAEYRLAYLPGHVSEGGGDSEFERLARAIDAGTEEQFYADYHWRIDPVSDDSPFFFNFHPWALSYLWSGLGGGQGAEGWHELTGGPIGMQILGSLLTMTTVLTALLVLVPLLFLRGGAGRPTRHAWRHLAYFLGLGAGFMFLEISTIQRLVLYLGHPTYSLTVTLFCFLFFAGLGSQFSRRFQGAPAFHLRWIVGLLAVLIALLATALDGVLDATLHLPLGLRIATAAGLLAPLNFLMGMPFPIGLSRLRELAPRLVPWALGANGAASVVASIACIALAMETGFRAVGLLSLAIYLVAMALFTTGPLAPGRADS